MRKTSKHKKHKTVSVEERGQAMNRQTFSFPPSTVEPKRKARNLELAFRPQGERRRAVDPYGPGKVTEIARPQVCDVVWSGIGHFSVVAGPSENLVGPTHQIARRQKPER